MRFGLAGEAWIGSARLGSQGVFGRGPARSAWQGGAVEVWQGPARIGGVRQEWKERQKEVIK